MNQIEKLIFALVTSIIMVGITFTVVGPSSAQPFEIWVDDDYCSGCPNDGHTWDYDAFAKIQDGIDAAASPGLVHVAAGIYFENIFLSSNLQVVGAGADVSMIDGGQNGSVVTASSVGARTILEGFKITNGTGTQIDGSKYGGGLYVINSSYLMVRKCIITENTAWGGASGIDVYDSTIGLYNSNINQNLGSGWCHSSSPVLC